MASPRREAYRERLRSARTETTYRRYAATTVLLAAFVAVGAGLLVAFVVGFCLSAPNARAALAGIDPTVGTLLSVLSPPIVALLVMVCGAIGGVVGAVGTHWYRWHRLNALASARERRIEITFSRTVALLYALSRGGVSIPEIMDTVWRNRAVYGAAADELGLAVRDMDLLGADVLTAVSRVGARTPSERFAGFCENLGTVLQSGADTASFLNDQYERHQREVESRQAAYLEWLATFAEAYVSVLVVGPLFLLTILIVMGLISGGIELVLALLVYLFIPLANTGFIIALDGFTGPHRTTAAGSTGHLAASAGEWRSPEIDADAPGLSSADSEIIDRLNAHERRRANGALADPIGFLTDRPVRLLYLTVPVAMLVIGVRIALVWSSGRLSLTAIDTTAIGVAIPLVGTFALVHEVRRRRLERANEQLPELLDRLASLNDAGISVVDAFERLGDSDLGALNPEIDRINRDIALGATVRDALARFDERAGTGAVTRAVTLITNAMRASGTIGPVLRIASEQARTTRTRKRKRRQEMAVYLAIIYLSFLVFLGIVFVLVVVFMPTIPSPADLGGNGIGGRAVGLSPSQKTTYVRLLFHAAAIQGVASGFVAGQMATGDVADGAKHAVVMLTIAFVSFLALA